LVNVLSLLGTPHIHAHRTQVAIKAPELGMVPLDAGE
jgi:hypothetical protein